MTPLREKYEVLHADYKQIVNIIEPKSKVLDLGCGSGELLAVLRDTKHVTGSGIEIDEEYVIACIKKGLSVIQGNLDDGLPEYQDKSYDYTILNLTLQVVRNPLLVLNEMLRVGQKAIVSFPNFGHWIVRYKYFFSGKMPKSRQLPFEWYNTPNIRLLTFKDFRAFCKQNNITILKEIPLLSADREPGYFPHCLANLLAEEGLFILTK
ncbi:MAG: methionine biosynthesis protein MetW [bacterium]